MRHKFNLQEHLELMSHLGALDEVIEKSIYELVQCLRDGGKVLLCGNGGSAADCQHIAAELTGRFIEECPPLAAIALSTDTSALTCIGIILLHLGRKLAGRVSCARPTGLQIFR
jgi:D-sedoheptulose 7-phosphate isomerase